MPEIEEGFRTLQIALDKDPNWSDAMAHINLLYRAKAMIADTQEESKALTRQADEWVDKALAAMRSAGGRAKAQFQITADAPPPLAVPAPPPPPPPPPPGTPRGHPNEGPPRV